MDILLIWGSEIQDLKKSPFPIFSLFIIIIPLELMRICGTLYQSQVATDRIRALERCFQFI
jgi:hypothetical protein